MRIVFLIIFAACVLALALNGCSKREEHGLALKWSDG
jgi:hypothetical protein